MHPDAGVIGLFENPKETGIYLVHVIEDKYGIDIKKVKRPG